VRVHSPFDIYIRIDGYMPGATNRWTTPNNIGTSPRWKSGRLLPSCRECRLAQTRYAK
jgi:hypothetical protein